MSVPGEFLRCLRNCVDALRDAIPADAELWRRALGDAQDTARTDLTRGAQQVLALSKSGAAAPNFERRADSLRFAELFDHLCQLCRSIAGNSPRSA
jgi:hypothetical protein